MQIPFNRPLVLGTEETRLTEVARSGAMSANGKYTSACHATLKDLSYCNPLLTTSCTAALDMAAVILNIGKGDEVIIPSYAFVTTANAFASRGAKILFADSLSDHPNINPEEIDRLVTGNTKAIVALHYGGAACNMDQIVQRAAKYGLKVIEDNAQGIGAYYQRNPLGSIGEMGAVSFHESKNVHCGEGGAIFINDSELASRAQMVWDMGTNKQAFKEGKVESYGWVDHGGSYYPSELNAAFLSAQLEGLEMVNKERIKLWNSYMQAFSPLEKNNLVALPNIPKYATHNGHIFYLTTRSKNERNSLIGWLRKAGISAAFHFQSLHGSAFFKQHYQGPELVNADKYSNNLVRLPLYYGLGKDIEIVIESVLDFYNR